MLQIHFIDDAGQPLCSIPDSDRWLWTVNAHAVTCTGCLAVLSAAAAPTDDAHAADATRRATPPVQGETASRTG